MRYLVIIEMLSGNVGTQLFSFRCHTLDAAESIRQWAEHDGTRRVLIVDDPQ